MLAIAIISLIATLMCAALCKADIGIHDRSAAAFWLTGIVFLAITVIAWWSIHLGIGILLLVIFAILYVYILGD